MYNKKLQKFNTNNLYSETNRTRSHLTMFQKTKKYNFLNNQFVLFLQMTQLFGYWVVLVDLFIREKKLKVNKIVLNSDLNFNVNVFQLA